jgi:DNA-binding CsgD family transcriptional regulator
MRDWIRLQRRLPELELRSVERRIARYLIEGRSSWEIASLMALGRDEVKTRIIVILHRLGRLPPDAPATADLPSGPAPLPLAPRRGLRLPAAQAGPSSSRLPGWLGSKSSSIFCSFSSSRVLD